MPGSATATVRGGTPLTSAAVGRAAGAATGVANTPLAGFTRSTITARVAGGRAGACVRATGGVVASAARASASRGRTRGAAAIREHDVGVRTCLKWQQAQRGDQEPKAPTRLQNRLQNRPTLALSHFTHPALHIEA